MIPTLFSRLIQYGKAYPGKVTLTQSRRSAVAHVYPAYRSYQAVQRGRGDELSNWLTYWGVLGLFHTGEVITDSFIWWLPFYEEAKILLVLWLVVPEGHVRSAGTTTSVQPPCSLLPCV